MKMITAIVLALGTCVGSAKALRAQVVTISEARARQIALARVPNNQGVLSTKLKTQSGILVYEYDIETPGAGHREVRVDARTGAVVATHHEDDLIGGSAKAVEKAANKVAKATEKAANKAAKEADKVFGKDEIKNVRVAVSEAEARRIALRQVPNGKIKDIDLERENGILLWEVEVDSPGKGNTELLIDAQTGAVLQQKRH